jgi:uncharacterized protein (TIGR02246 family)
MKKIHAQNAETVVQRNLNAYNARDLKSFMNDFTEDIILINFNDGKIVAEGKTAIEKLYSDLFNQSPKLHSTILKRIVIGNKVIDHESIIGRKGATDPIELVMIYEVRDDRIFKMTVIRP